MKLHRAAILASATIGNASRGPSLTKGGLAAKIRAKRRTAKRSRTINRRGK